MPGGPRFLARHCQAVAGAWQGFGSTWQRLAGKPVGRSASHYQGQPTRTRKALPRAAGRNQSVPGLIWVRVSGVRTGASACRLATFHRRQPHDGLELGLGHAGDGNLEDVPGPVGPEKPEPPVARVSVGTRSDATNNRCLCRVWSVPRHLPRRPSVSASARFVPPALPSCRYEILGELSRPRPR